MFFSCAAALTILLHRAVWFLGGTGDIVTSEITRPSKVLPSEQTRPGKEPPHPTQGSGTPRSQQPNGTSNSTLLNPPTFVDGSSVTGATKERWRLQNKRERVSRQAVQPDHTHWCTHTGKKSLPPLRPGPANFRNAMCPSHLALHHPAAKLLLEYASKGSRA
jgi:hypothetical protein